MNINTFLFKIITIFQNCLRARAFPSQVFYTNYQIKIKAMKESREEILCKLRAYENTLNSMEPLDPIHPDYPLL